MAQISGEGAVGRAVEGLGAAVGGVGEAIFERETAATLAEADTAVSAQLRDLLYNPETGFTALRGQAAVSQQAAVMARIDALNETATANMSQYQRNLFRDSLARRQESARQSVQLHTLGARDEWLAGASAARVESAYQDSIANPSATAQALQIIGDETRARGLREGWDAERTAVELEAATSAVYVNQIARIEASDPVQAMEYLRQNEANMRPSDVAELEARLQPAVRERIGRDLGAAAANGAPVLTHSIPIEMNLGPARPNPPGAAVQSVIGRSVQDVFGQGARVIITSGQEDEGEQHGSNRHGTGHAADIQIIRADGSVVNATDPDAQEFARAAARNGALGIGFGSEYMGGTHFHVDLVEPGAGQANTWASGGTAMRSEIVDIINNRPVIDGGMEALIAIEDPTERAAAIQEYELITGARGQAQRQAMAQAQNSVFQHLTAGGRLTDLPLDVKQGLGQEAMTSLMAYERSVATGVPVETDPTTYLSLRQMHAEDPETFRDLPLSNPRYVDRLSLTDWKAMVDLQVAPIEPERFDVPAPSTLLSEASAQLRAAGITESEAPDLYARFQSNMLRWADGNPQAASDPLQRNQQIARLLLPVMTTVGRNRNLRLFEIDFDGSTRTTDDDMTADQINENAGRRGLYVNETLVQPADMEKVYRDLLGVINQRPSADIDLDDPNLMQPTGRQIIEALGLFYQ
jgi:hypothetical protein